MRNKVIDHLKRYNPEVVPRVIFDIGANTGQSAVEFAAAFPTAVIHAFEPVRASFDELQKNTHAYSNVRCHTMAFSDSNREGFITSKGISTGNRLVARDAKVKTEKIEIVRGDDYCEKKGIKSVDILKIDTEGADLSVLVGFGRMLASRSFVVIQAETGLAPENDRHASLEQISMFLFPFGYRILGFFGLARHLGGQSRGRGAMFCDTAFICEENSSDLAKIKE